jgi:putative inorganic carbon (hco3(-)) transporter
MTYTTVMTQKLERYTQYGLLIILALMPFHAFLSVWLGHVYGHETEIEAWKEVVLLILAALSALLVWSEPKRLGRLRRRWIVITAAFTLVALVVTVFARPPLTAIAFGAKTDLEFLFAAVIATLVATPRFVRQAVAVVLIGATVVVGFGLLEIFVLPLNFLSHFGYGPTTLLPYELISGTTTPRFASTLGGPNQLGTYLILPICLSLALAIRRKQWWWLALTIGSIIVLGTTYSRGAWIGAAAAMLITLLSVLPSPRRRMVLMSLAAVGLIAGIALIVAVGRSPRLQTYLLHQNPTAQTTQPSSDAQHASSLRAGLHDLAAGPFGHGLGSAGPATFHAGSLRIIEDYYLQLAYETGLLGGLLFLVLFILLVKDIWPIAPPLGHATAATLIGIGIVALVLPAWTDSSTALIAWIIVGSVASLTPESRHV